MDHLVSALNFVGNILWTDKKRKHTRYVTVNTRVVCLCLSSDGMVDGRYTERDLSITKRPGFYASCCFECLLVIASTSDKGKTNIEIRLPPKLAYPLKNAGWVRGRIHSFSGFVNDKDMVRDGPGWFSPVQDIHSDALNTTIHNLRVASSDTTNLRPSKNFLPGRS